MLTFTSIRSGLAFVSPHSLALLSTRAALPNRAVVYAQNGDPTEVLSVVDYPPLPTPPPQTANIRFLLSPINPADVNVVEGVYPIKAVPAGNLMAQGKSQEKCIFIGGNEGLAQVVSTGHGVMGLQEGDWVVMLKQQAGTWCSERNVHIDDVLKVPLAQDLTEVQAATMTVNPPTAYNMLHTFVNLERGDWIIQNGANSAVGQAVIQIAAAKGINTLNFVRNRHGHSGLKGDLLKLGATYVMTYDDLNDKSIREKVMSLTSGTIRLGLNCIGGRETTLMARLLGTDSHLVSYGAMSKQPLSLPTSLFIFKNLTAHGFWQSQWYKGSSRDEQTTLMCKIARLFSEQKLAAPSHEIVTISAGESCERATERVKAIFSRLSEGRYGRKILLRFQSLS